MKRIVLLGAVGLIALLSLPHTASAFGWKDVIQMHHDGVPDSLIIQKIEHSGKSFSLSPKQIHALMEADVSDGVISAMLQTEDRGGYDYDGSYRYYHPRAYAGFAFHYYDGWPYYRTYWPYRYYGDYYYPRHYLYYEPRHFRYDYPRGTNYGMERQRTDVTPRSGWWSSGSGARTGRGADGGAGSGAGTRTRRR